MTIENDQKEWYKEYYSKAGADRNNLRVNPGVLFQTLAAEKAFVLASRKMECNLASAKVLDVGCGNGADLYQLLRMECAPVNIVGVDIQKERIDSAKLLYPSIRFVHGDASKLDFPGNSFDLVFESTMFVSLPDHELSLKIADEMLRVCRPGGYLLLVDWRTPKPGDPNYKALTKARLASLFKLGEKTELIGAYKGALVPPIGRFLSKYLPGLYFLVAALFPFLVGQVAYLVRKKA